MVKSSSFNLSGDFSKWKENPLDVKDDLSSEKRKLHIRWGTAMCLAVCTIIGLVIGLSVVSSGKDHAEPTPPSVRQSPQATTSVPVWPQTIGEMSVLDDLSVSFGDKVSFLHDNSTMINTKSDPIMCSTSGDNRNNICLEWPNDRRLNISTFPPKTQTSKTNLSDHTLSECYIVEWTGLRCPDQILTDCFDVTKAHWYGGFEENQQLWPLERNNITFQPYVSRDGYTPGIGNVLERYFVTSNGVGLRIDNDVPLYFRLNSRISEQGKMCFTAKFGPYPYFNPQKVPPFLKYILCNGPNVLVTHKRMSEMFISRPKAIPSEALFRYPIFSTWAQYHYDINQTSVLQFARDIKMNNFTCSQVEIDDVWTPKYGDLEFDTVKFPNATEMVLEIQQIGFNVTVWVQPFFNADSHQFKELESKGYLLKQLDRNFAARTQWWDGNDTGLLDISNKHAQTWFLQKLKNVTEKFNVDSFKFDAGEVTWFPNAYSVHNRTINPCDMYPHLYVKTAVKADTERRQEVRSAYRNQDIPVFIRQMDKFSTWSHSGGFASIIPGAFTFGILGYPFILPDMIGGNAYEDRYPDPELFIRWSQLNTFLPGLQYSIVPWKFNESVVSIVRRYTEMHTQYADDLIHWALNAVETGEPIIRPLWWIDPTNETALTCEDEFLVGDQYLVAPVMQAGARSRDIYIPSGDWLDMLHGNGTFPVYSGPILLKNYTVELQDLAYFTNVNYLPK